MRILKCVAWQENVLVNASGQPVICDFGLSRMLSYSQTILASTSYKNTRGSIRWMAYELLQTSSDLLEAKIEVSSPEGNDTRQVADTEQNRHTKASDMWAFGMVTYVRSHALYCRKQQF